MLLGDLLSPTKQGGLLPNMAISFPADFRREIAFKNFLVFRDLPDYEVPFDMHSYFQLRWTDEGIRSGNSESIDSTVARQVTDPSSGLDNLACFFWDTPLSDIVSGINAVKGVLDHSLIASPNSKSTSYLVNAKLADFKAVFSHLGTVEGPRFSAAPAMERVKAIEMLKDNWRNLSASQGAGSSSSSASGGISTSSYATAGFHATPYMVEMESFPVDEKGQDP
jgi:hypothetical protein